MLNSSRRFLWSGIYHKSTSLAYVLVGFARLCLGAAVLVAPTRLRITLLARSFPPVYQDYTDLYLHPVDVVLLLALSAWLISLLLEMPQISWGPLVLTLPLAGLWLTGLISVPFSVDPLLSLFHWLRVTLLFGIYLFIVNEIRDIGLLFWGLASALVLHAGIAVAQALGGHSLGLQILGEPVVDISQGSASTIWTGTLSSLRAYGLSDHPNLLGGLLVFSLLLLLTIFLQRTPGQIMDQIMPGLVIAGSSAILLTFSFSAWVGLLAAFIFLVWMVLKHQSSSRSKRFLLLLACCGLGLFPLIIAKSPLIAVTFFPNAFQSENIPQASSSSQMEILSQVSNQIFADHAITGVGLAAFPVALHRDYPNFGMDYQPAHNALLDAAAETGIFGALFYAIVLASPWFLITLRRKKLQLNAALIGISAVLIAVSVVSMLDYYPWMLPPGKFWQWLVWGLWAATFQGASQKGKS